MIVPRRQLLGMGGGLFVVLTLPPALVLAEDIAEIVMQGRPDGSLVWFDPIGIHVKPGQTVRWTNHDKANSHTTTAYHPDNDGRPLRIPKGAAPWTSDYLLPGESFSVRLTIPGVYDYCCIPHEHAGMVGRIIVGEPPADQLERDARVNDGMPEVALKAFPSVDEIMTKGVVRRG